MNAPSTLQKSVCVCVCVGVCVCVCVGGGGGLFLREPFFTRFLAACLNQRERQATEKRRDGDRQRQTGIGRDRQTDGQTDRQTEYIRAY